MSEDDGLVVTADVIVLPTTRREVREGVLVAPTLVQLELLEEEGQELLIFEAGDEVLDFGIIQEKLCNGRGERKEEKKKNMRMQSLSSLAQHNHHEGQAEVGTGEGEQRLPGICGCSCKRPPKSKRSHVEA